MLLTSRHLIVFGHRFHEFEGRMSIDLDFVFHVAVLDRWSDVLRWYINFNIGGTPHSPDGIAKGQKMLDEALAKENK